MNLATYIKSRNSVTLAWIAEDPANRGACLIVDDLNFWAQQGITTVEQFERDSLVSLYCDLYEDAHNGFSPSSIDSIKSMTNEQIEKECEWLRECIKGQAKAEAEELAEHVKWMEEQEKKEAEARANAEWEQKWGVYYERA